MASKKASGPARGASLVKKAIEAAAATIPAPEPVPAGALKKLRLPDEEKLPAGLKTWLAFDSTFLGWEIDDEEPEFEAMGFADVIEEVFGEEAVPAFGEACELLEGDCVLIEGEGETRSFLYVGTPDELGEYAVISVAHGDKARVAGFMPFDVWIAQRMGVVAKGEELGWVPDEYVPAAQALADANAGGKRAFDSEHREIERESDDEDEDEGGEG
jgi:hypothetical protein